MENLSIEKKNLSQVLMAHARNPSYSERNQED
jgi:hypothetical protein